MADEASSSVVSQYNQKSTRSSRSPRTRTFSALHKVQRNRGRKNRRKRSRTRFFQQLKLNRATRELIEATQQVTVFDFTAEQPPSMQPADNMHKYSQLPQEVAQWQNQHQLAYWKSRAISLEYENKMLQNVVKEMCRRNLGMTPSRSEAERVDEGEQDEDHQDYEDKQDYEDEEGGETTEDQRREEEREVNMFSLPPTEQMGKSEREERIKMYGDTSPKIIGMETALQLSYDFNVEHNKPPYWPNIPLNL